MKLNNKQRDELTEKAAQKLTDKCDMYSLLEAFYVSQIEYIEDLSDQELIDLVIDLDLEETLLKDLTNEKSVV
jgi:Mn-dependent DtxR family transcriptional regulator